MDDAAGTGAVTSKASDSVPTASSDSKPTGELLRRDDEGESESGAATGRPSKWRLVGLETKELVKLSLPLMITMASTSGIAVTDQIVIGQLVGTTEALAAVGISNTIYAVIWITIYGASTALDTLGSQAWGAGRPRSLYALGTVCLVTLMVLSALGAALLLAAGPIAEHALNQEPETAAMVADFCALLVPGLFGTAAATALMKLVQVQGRVVAPMCICGFTLLLNMGLSVWLVDTLGFIGAPLAASIARVTMLLATLLYLAWRPLLPDPLQRMHVRDMCSALGGWLGSPGSFPGLAAAGALLTVVQVSAFEVMSILAALLGVQQVAAHMSVTSLTAFTCATFSLGIGHAIAIRVGNLLGRGDGYGAKVSASVGVCLGSTVMVVCGAITLAAKDELGKAFSSSPEVLAIIADILPLAALFQALDGVFSSTYGALQGVGRQKQLALFNLLGLWGAGVTLAATLAFAAGMGLNGLWTGAIAGTCVTSLLAGITLLRLKWGVEADRAAARAGAEGHSHWFQGAGNGGAGERGGSGSGSAGGTLSFGALEVDRSEAVEPPGPMA